MQQTTMANKRFGVLFLIALTLVCLLCYHPTLWKTTVETFNSLHGSSTSTQPEEIQRIRYSQPETDLPFHVTSSLHLMADIVKHRDQQCNKEDEKNLTYKHLEVELKCMVVSTGHQNNIVSTGLQNNSIVPHCYVWYWDVANWTLTYTHKEMELNETHTTILCPIPIHSVSSKNVYPAKIIHPDATVEYPGCSIKNSLCSPSFDNFYAWYDEGLKLRINRTPCCRKLLTEITLHTGKVFDKHNITWFLCGGEVITVVRDNGEMIPYDTDSDFAVDVKDVGKVDDIMSELQAPGYEYRWKMDVGDGKKLYMVGCTNSKRCLTGPGIAFYHVEGGLLKSAPTWHNKMPAEFSLPPSSHMFMGEMMKFPHDPVRFLNSVYGAGKWETSLTCKTHHYGQCKT